MEHFLLEIASAITLLIGSVLIMTIFTLGKRILQCPDSEWENAQVKRKKGTLSEEDIENLISKR